MHSTCTSVCLTHLETAFVPELALSTLACTGLSHSAVGMQKKENKKVVEAKICLLHKVPFRTEDLSPS